MRSFAPDYRARQLPDVPEERAQARTGQIVLERWSEG